MEKSVPKLFEEVTRRMDGILYTVEFRNDIKNPLAFTYRNIGNRLGFDYKIVCNGECPRLYPFLFLHESGHVLFNHCKVDKIEGFLVKNKIKVAWEKIKNHFEGYDQEEVYNYFENYLYNIVMDWEVNSKLSTLEEVEKYEKYTSEFLETEVQMCYPTRYGYPEKKNWLEYITLITLDPDKFLDNMKKNQENNSNQGNSEGQGGGSSEGNESNNNDNNSGNGNGNGDKSDKKGDGSSGDLTEEEISKIVSEMKNAFDKEQNKNKEESVERVKDAAEAAANDSQSYSFDRSGGDSNKIENNCLYSKSDEELERNILSCLEKENHKNTKVDPVYYYNRNKYNSNVMFIKEKAEVTKKKNNLCVLLDVSGSNDMNNINRFVNIFKRICKKLKKGCSLILWDTDLVAEYNSLTEEIESFCGGGTNMASGLEYIDRNSKYKKDTIFIVSDFCDALSEWKFSRSIYGICWDETAIKEYKENFLDNEYNKKYFNKLFKKIIIDKNDI